MRTLRWLGFLLFLFCFDTSAEKGKPLPSSDQLAKWMEPYLMKPLPTVEAITGIAMPPPAPLMVVASLGDDEAVPDLDRGYAIGFTLNELLFDADPQLDVVAPWSYADDTRKKNAPRGTKRDSAANAHRAGLRDDARWCTYGRVSGAKPTRVELVVETCASDAAPLKRQWTVKSESDWPATLAEMCEFAAASALGQITEKARSSCSRARDIRPESLMALARYGGHRSREGLDAMYAADPAFAPAAVEYLTWLNRDTSRYTAYWERVGEIAKAAPQSPAVQLLAHQRKMRVYGWNIDMDLYRDFFAWLRQHPSSSAAWIALAGSLASDNPYTWPPDESTLGFWEYIWRYALRVVGKKPDNPPNEATHSASLAIAFAIYRARPNDYKAQWTMGHSMERYGWMLRGGNFWSDAPKIGKRGFPVFEGWADRFYVSALHIHPEAGKLWANHMNTTAWTGGDWIAIFYKAAEVEPHNYALYERAMEHALPQWGGDAATRKEIADVALKNNPDAAWAKNLLERYEKRAAKFEEGSTEE